MIILEDMPHDERVKYLEKNRKEKEQNNNQVKDYLSEPHRYRCEQTAVIRVNGLVVTSGETKREFIIKKLIRDGSTYISVKLVDNIVMTKPEKLLEGVKLISEVDEIKCSHVIVKLNNQTGKIEKIENHNAIIVRWNDYKSEFLSRFSYFKGEDNQKLRDQFVDVNEYIIKNKQVLIDDLNTKLFFDIFFDKYLVVKNDLFSPYKRIFNSQLLDGVQIELDFKQTLLQDAPDGYKVKKTGRLNNKKLDTALMEEIYNDKYKPYVHYKFSEYDYMWIEDVTMNTENDYWITEAKVHMAERIKNNVDVLINYELRKLE